MAKHRLHPAQVSVQHALGNFLPCFEAVGVIISCLQQGNVYHFGQWSAQWGKMMALGQCRHLDLLGYQQLWWAPPTGGPVAGTGVAFNVSGLTDEQVLKRFCQAVACDAALLQYNITDLDDVAFWRYSTPAGRVWTRKHATSGLHDSHQTMWNEVGWKNQTLSPATYEEVVRVTGHDSRLATSARGKRWGWTEDHVTLLNEKHRIIR